jgi:hypothetical protein
MLDLQKIPIKIFLNTARKLIGYFASLLLPSTNNKQKNVFITFCDGIGKVFASLG